MYSSYLKYGRGPAQQNFISNENKSKNQSNKQHCDCLNCLINCVQYKFILQVIQDKKYSKNKIFFVIDKDNISSPLFFYETPSNEIIELIQNKNISENFLSISQKIKSENDIINNYDQNKKNKILLFNYLKFPLVNINSESNNKKQSTIIILDDGKYDEISNYSIKSYSTFNKNYSLLFDIHNLRKADYLFTINDIKDCEEIKFRFNGDLHGHKLFQNDADCSLNPNFIINSIKTRMEKNFNLDKKEIINNLYDKFFFAQINDQNRNNIGILFSFNNEKDINKIKFDKEYILNENYRINKLFICVDMWINNNNIETKDTSKSISIITKSNNKQEDFKIENFKNDNNNIDYNYINNNNIDNHYINLNNNYLNNNYNYSSNYNNEYTNNYNEYNNNYSEYNNNYNEYNNNYSEYNNNYSEYNNNYNEYNNNYNEYNNNYSGYNNNYSEYNDYYNEYNNSYNQYNKNYNKDKNNTYSYNYNKKYENDNCSSSFVNYENNNNVSSKQSVKEDFKYSSNNTSILDNNNNYNRYKNNFENKEYLEKLTKEKYYELNALFNNLNNSQHYEIANKSSFLKEEIKKDIQNENQNSNKSLFLDINKKILKEIFSKYKQDNCISNYTILKNTLDIKLNIDKEKLKKIKLKYFYYCFKDINNLTINTPYINKRGKLFLNELYPTLSQIRLILKINNKKIINKIKKQKKENFNIKKIKQNILKIEYQENKPPYERGLLYNKINDIIQILGENKLTFNNVLIDKSFLCILWNSTNNILTNSSFLAYYSLDLKLIGILIIKLNSFQWFSSFSNNINNFKDYKKEYDKNVENIKRFFANLAVDKEEGYYKNFITDDYLHYIKNSNN